MSTEIRPAAPAPAGWYPFGRAGEVAEWDGRAWGGRSRSDDTVPEPPCTRHRVLAVVTHRWLWLLLSGLVVTTLGGVVGGRTAPAPWWLFLVVPGLLLTGAAIVEMLRPRLRFEELPRPALLVACGVGSGVVAVGLAYLIEGRLWPALGFSFALDLWLAGVVEETCKLLVPLLLFVFGGSRFRDPRVGLLLAVLSGATFGVVEGVQYVDGPGQNVHLLMAMVRPLAEAGHPLWVASAAALIWLGAHRRRRLVTLTGLVGWLLAAGQHSLHDGLASGRVSHTTRHPDYGVTSLGEVVVSGIVENLFSIVWLAIGYVILRHVARELVPPSAALANPPRWRPRLKQWGVPRSARGPGPQEEPTSGADAGSVTAQPGRPRP